MRAAGFSENEIATMVFDNPLSFFERSGKINRSAIAGLKIDQTELFEGNSVLRGQAPVRQV